jgi:hypothetical protein
MKRLALLAAWLSPFAVFSVSGLLKTAQSKLPGGPAVVLPMSFRRAAPIGTYRFSFLTCLDERKSFNRQLSVALIRR